MTTNTTNTAGNQQRDENAPPPPPERDGQAEMRIKMVAQHRAMRCIGCGEAGEYF